MENTFLVIVTLSVMGCGKLQPPLTQQQIEKMVIGEYQYQQGENSFRLAFQEKGIAEWYSNGKQLGKGVKWGVSGDAELHIDNLDAGILVYRINGDGSITQIAILFKDGKRRDLMPQEQLTWKRIE